MPRPSRETLALLALALALRLGTAYALDTPGHVERGVWEWGFEASCIADSLARGEGFANVWTRDVEPWSLGSGPTAWLSPLYPGLLALLFELCGGLSRGAAWSLFALQSLASALTCWLLLPLGARLGAPRAGRIAAWAFVLHPLAVWHASQTVWDTTFAALALTSVLTLLAGCELDSGRRGWTLLGLAFGLAALVNAAVLAALPAIGWCAWRSRRSFGAWLGAIGPFALAAFALVLPWMARNASEVGAFALRTNLAVELRVGNSDAARGHYRRELHPSDSPVEFLRYRELGEARYSDWARAEALEWIGAHPLGFLRLSAARAAAWCFGEPPWLDPREDHGRTAREDWKSWVKWLVHLTTGVVGLAGALAWARARRAPRPILSLVVLVPPVYCMTHVMERYRFPIEPLLVLCAAWLANHLLAGRRATAQDE